MEEDGSHPPLTDSVDEVVKVLERGGVALLPAETVIGLSCDATNEDAARRIISIKQREKHAGFIVLVSSESMAEFYTEDFDIETYKKVRENFGEYPTTIIFPTSRNLPSIVCGEDASIALRITTAPHLLSIIDRLGRGIVSTSANISGEPPPTSLSSVSKEIISKVDIIFWREDIVMTGTPSRIIRIKGDSFEILR